MAPVASPSIPGHRTMETGDIRMTRDLFLWCMSVIYLFAFASLFVQIPGLYGENGILPAKLVIKPDAESFYDLFTTQPTLLRLLPKVGLDLDTGMDFLCMGGALLAFVAMVSRDQRNSMVFAVLWVFYLSLFQVGQTFLWFQWDILLLEAGFLTILVSPLNFFGYLDGTWNHSHDRITLWLVKWLLFRRTLSAGLVKLAEENSSWWTLTEMNHHYETQNLPTPLAWYFHQLPDWIQRLSAVAVLTIQILISLFFFSPLTNHRLFAFYAQCLLSTVLMLSGNYGFYTLLTLTLTLSLLDDDWLQSWTGGAHTDRKSVTRSVQSGGVLSSNTVRWIFGVAAYAILALIVVRLFSLEINFHPLSINSSTSFSRADLEGWLQYLTPLSILIGACSLVREILLSFYCSLSDKQKFNKRQRLSNVVGCLVFGLTAIAIFILSLVPHAALDKTTETRVPTALKDLHSSASARYMLASPYIFYSRANEEMEEGGRAEVVLEGSDLINGDNWKEYNFRFKPGNTTHRLPIVSPHQPRLDWQMQFAARGDYQNNHWLLNLVYRLLTNQKEVLELMGENPFPDRAPKYIRSTLYRYYFASSDSSDETYSSSNWWVREPVGEYLPILSLDETSLMDYIKQTGLMTDVDTSDDISAVKPSSSSWNLLRSSLERMRSLFGQANGSWVCLVLVVTGFLLTLLDPSINLFRTPDETEPLPNGNLYGPLVK